MNNQSEIAAVVRALVALLNVSGVPSHVVAQLDADLRRPRFRSAFSRRPTTVGVPVSRGTWRITGGRW